jgi:hypothetical protein
MLWKLMTLPQITESDGKGKEGKKERKENRSEGNGRKSRTKPPHGKILVPQLGMTILLTDRRSRIIKTSGSISMLRQAAIQSILPTYMTR